ncbi:MAG: hypothetical protein B6D59_05290 [Campylobacteraceae bacterium 4484_4]|nr:MAG: hypothetical protein B6D59_05290 [Campylobacteraceae bacterium 4484_4]
MDLGDIVQMGTQLFKERLGDQAGEMDDNSLMDALSGLLSNEEGGLDLSNIMSALTNGDLGSIVSSWIGSGENAPIEGSQLSELLGSDQISAFAEKLGIDTDTALSGLTDALPNMIDRATPEGESLLDQVGGLDGIMDMASKFFGRS